MTSKVEQKRERNLANAVECGDWIKVDKLLNQPINNLERKERHYGVISLNLTISNDGKDTEILDLYSDNTYNPIEQLLIKERNEFLINALSKLSKDDLQIFLEITLILFKNQIQTASTPPCRTQVKPAASFLVS